MLGPKDYLPTMEENYFVTNVEKQITLSYSVDILIVSSVITEVTPDINQRGVSTNRDLAMMPY